LFERVGMSAFPKADKVRRSKIALFDHLVGAGV
jgi:hypothetical protein